jgi:16S rRNA (uracil1498-N3)-methyltransferase
MHRFYLPDGIPADGPVQFPRDIARQMSRVLRMREGEKVGVFDGSGNEWTIELDNVASRTAAGHIVDVTRPSTEPAVDITLYQSLIDAAQFELVLQKGVELGVKRFVPLLTDPPGHLKNARRAGRGLLRKRRSSLVGYSSPELRLPLSWAPRLVCHLKAGLSCRGRVSPG